MIEAKFKTGIKLSDYTTFKIGGEARYFLSVMQKQDLLDAIRWCQVHYVPFFILGGGSNVLAADSGFNGLVIHIANDQIVVHDKTLVVDAGVALVKLVNTADSSGLSGLSWASGIPGTVGGAVRGNAGAYGGEIKDNFHSVEYLDANDLCFHNMTSSDCEFAYRHSKFKDNPHLIIWQIKFMLGSGDSDSLRKESLKIFKQRMSKLPLTPSAGCVFKNIVLNKINNKNLVFQELVSNSVVKNNKLACGLIIEKLSLKGESRGGARVANDHANFIINENKASSSDVLALIDVIKKTAKEKMDLDLEEEIVLLG